MAKEIKTAEELKSLLDESILKYSLGAQPNARWVKIVGQEGKPQLESIALCAARRAKGGHQQGNTEIAETIRTHTGV